MRYLSLTARCAAAALVWACTTTPSYATHGAGGTCGHTHFDTTHGECNNNVEGSDCTVNAQSGTCRQTSSNCQCRVPGSAAAQQETGINVIGGLLEEIITARRARATLTAAVAAAEMNALYGQLFAASSTLNGLGTTLNANVDINVGAKLDAIALNLAAARVAMLSTSTVPREQVLAEFLAITNLIRLLKEDWANQFGN